MRDTESLDQCGQWHKYQKGQNWTEWDFFCVFLYKKFNNDLVPKITFFDEWGPKKSLCFGCPKKNTLSFCSWGEGLRQFCKKREGGFLSVQV